MGRAALSPYVHQKKARGGVEKREVSHRHRREKGYVDVTDTESSPT